METTALYMNIPKEIKKYLKKKAIDEDVTMTDYIIKLIERDMKESE